MRMISIDIIGLKKAEIIARNHAAQEAARRNWNAGKRGKNGSWQGGCKPILFLDKITGYMPVVWNLTTKAPEGTI